MSAPPPRRIINAFLAPVSHIKRRVEIYESDGLTPWKPDMWDDILVASGGSVSANYGEKERRTFECELDNSTGELDPVPGGLWYDKIFKVFYGVSATPTEENQPRVLIMEEDDAPGEAQHLRSAFYAAGLTNVHFNPDVRSLGDMAQADIIVSISAPGTKRLSLLTQAMEDGKGVITFSGNGTQVHYPAILTSMQPVGGSAYFEVEPRDASLFGTATRWPVNAPSVYRRVLLTNPAVSSVADAVRFTESTATGSPFAMLLSRPGRGGWVHVMQHNFSKEIFSDSDGVHSAEGYNSFTSFLSSTVKHLYGRAGDDFYECQIGEFVSSSIGHANETGDTVSVACIDYTKRCSDSKLAAATMFEEGEILEVIVRAVASNCGIRKFNLPVTNEGIQRDIVFERDTSRWDVMYKLTSELGYDLYFDGEGRLTMKRYTDPAKDSPSLVLKSGIGGNLVSRRLSTSDARLFNHVVIVGESSDADAPPVWGEAINRVPGSPTSIDKIGDRVITETMSSITTKDKAEEVARQLLAVSMLEEFELNFSSVFFPWIEPGELVEYVDETRQHWGPSRYLITSLDLPLDLGPMSGTGKRVVNLQ